MVVSTRAGWTVFTGGGLEGDCLRAFTVRLSNGLVICDYLPTSYFNYDIYSGFNGRTIYRIYDFVYLFAENVVLVT